MGSVGAARRGPGLAVPEAIAGPLRATSDAAVANPRPIVAANGYDPGMSIDRRSFLGSSALGAAAFSVPGEFAQRLTETPDLAEGPFYPDTLPLDTDNDLLVLNDSLTPAVGTITHLSGRILSAAGEPVRNAFVEIWQVDNHGSYLHSQGEWPEGRDANFQGYGRFLTDVRGQYYFRTVRPVPYGDRVPHVHLAVSRNGRRLLSTQILIAGYRGNEKDGVVRRLDAEQLAAVCAEYRPLPGSKLGEMTADFDVVLGHTPEEHEEEIKGGIGRRQRRR